MARESDLAYWFDVTTDLLQRPLTKFPAADLAAHLNHSFELTSLSWEWRETENEYGFTLFAGHRATFSPSTLEAFPAQEVMARHPLLQRFAATQNPTPHSVGRIPEAMVSTRHRAWFGENLQYGCEHQVSIPYRMHGVSYGRFVMTRPDNEFDAEEMDLVRRLQRLMASLDVQVRAQRGRGEFVPSGTAVQVGLTGTEVAVLSFLAQGYTAHGIARRLSNSPRTVQKHLEHIYRKLGVSDRLMAVQVAAELGLRAGGPPEPAGLRQPERAPRPGC